MKMSMITVAEKVREIDRKLDGLKDFLEEIFLTPEEYRLIKEADRSVEQRNLNGLVPLDELQNTSQQKNCKPSKRH